MAHFMGLTGPDVAAAIECWIGGPLPPGFTAAREAEDARVMASGIDAVAGAVPSAGRLPSRGRCVGAVETAVLAAGRLRFDATAGSPKRCERRRSLATIARDGRERH